MPPTRYLHDLSREELIEYFAEIGEPAFRADQVMRWLYQKEAVSYSSMTNIRKELHKKLESSLTLTPPQIGETLESQDGSKKFSLILQDGFRIESVIIPEASRITLCVSTQAGCRRGCALCSTGRMGFHRNLTSGEMLLQIITANKMLSAGSRITHLVFMGMGEPMDNLDELLKALTIIHADYGICLSPRRTTISTVGVPDGICRFASEGNGEGLAISLHASNDETRQKLIPLAHKVSLTQLLDAAHQYARRWEDKITFEYVMIKDVNCSEADGIRLAKLLSRLPSKINLIPYNNAAKGEFNAPSEAEIERFKRPLMDSPVIVTVRRSRGRDIRAACGQLGGKG